MPSAEPLETTGSPLAPRAGPPLVEEATLRTGPPLVEEVALRTGPPLVEEVALRAGPVAG